MLENKVKLRANGLRKLISPIVLLIYMSVILLFFLLTVRYLSKNINLVLSSTSDTGMMGQLTSLDLANYELLAKKLNIPITKNIVIAASSSVSATKETSNIVLPIPVATSTENVASTSIKLNLNISVINSTKKNGLAGELRNMLVKAGVPVKTIGNQNNIIPETVLGIKKSAEIDAEQIEKIKKILSDKYIFQSVQLPETSDNDLQIIIGNR